MKKSLNITGIKQIGENGCFGAAAEMIYRYLKPSKIVPENIINAKYSKRVGSACALLEKEGEIVYGLFTTTIPSPKEILEEIVKKENPILSLLTTNKIKNGKAANRSGDHWVIISGVDYEGTLEFNEKGNLISSKNSFKLNGIQITDPDNAEKIWVDYNGNDTLYNYMYFQNSNYCYLIKN